VTTYIVVWRVVTPIGPRRETTRFFTWPKAERFIAMAEGMGIEVPEVVFL